MPIIVVFPVAFAVALLAAAWSDARHYRIPNLLTLGILVLYGLFYLSAMAADFPIGRPALGTDLLVAFLVFCLCFALFAGGMLGGGDAKIIPVVTLWAGVTYTPAFIIVMTIAGGLLALVYWIARRSQCASLALGGVEVPRATSRIPYGIAIAAGGLFVASQLIINGYPSN